MIIRILTLALNTARICAAIFSVIAVLGFTLALALKILFNNDFMLDKVPLWIALYITMWAMGIGLVLLALLKIAQWFKKLSRSE